MNIRLNGGGHLLQAPRRADKRERKRSRNVGALSCCLAAVLTASLIDCGKATSADAKKASIPDSPASADVKVPKLDPLAARKQLAQLGIVYSVNNFVFSAGEGDTIAVSYFLDAGMDVNSKGEKDTTALELAANFGRTETLNVLLERGADPNLASGRFFPVVMAASQGHLESVKILMDHGVAARSPRAQAALYFAVLKNQPAVVGYLVGKGVDANYIEEERRDTLPMKAAMEGNTEVLKALLVKATNINATNAEGLTAIDFAFYRIFKDAPVPRTGKSPDDWPDETVRLLVKAGASVYTDYYIQQRGRFLASVVPLKARFLADGGQDFQPVLDLIDTVTSELSTNGVPARRYLPLLESVVDAIGRARFTYSTTIESVGPTDGQKAAMKGLINLQRTVTIRCEQLRGSGESMPDSEILRKNAFLKLVAAKNEVYRGEVLPLEIRLYALRGNVRQSPKLIHVHQVIKCHSDISPRNLRAMPPPLL